MAANNDAVNHNSKKHIDCFKRAILSISNGTTFYEAMREWKHESITYGDGKCICGVNIMEQFHVVNTLNGNKAIIGNVCIKRFNNMNTHEIYMSLAGNAAECEYCGNEKPLDTKQPMCAECRLPCTCGNRKRTTAPCCMECRQCACGNELERDEWGSNKQCHSCILKALPHCTSCDRVRTDINRVQCSTCTTYIGFGKYKDLTPVRLFNKDPNYVEWLIKATADTRPNLVATLIRIKAKQ